MNTLKIRLSVALIVLIPVIVALQPAVNLVAGVGSGGHVGG